MRQFFIRPAALHHLWMVSKKVFFMKTEPGMTYLISGKQRNLQRIPCSCSRFFFSRFSQQIVNLIVCFKRNFQQLSHATIVYLLWRTQAKIKEGRNPHWDHPSLLASNKPVHHRRFRTLATLMAIKPADNASSTGVTAGGIATGRKK